MRALLSSHRWSRAHSSASPRWCQPSVPPRGEQKHPGDRQPATPLRHAPSADWSCKPPRSAVCGGLATGRRTRGPSPQRDAPRTGGAPCERIADRDEHKLEDRHAGSSAIGPLLGFDEVAHLHHSRITPIAGPHYTTAYTGTFSRRPVVTELTTPWFNFPSV
jgi:hypothetical protein